MVKTSYRRRSMRRAGELAALPGAVSFSAAGDPLLALRAITGGTCCECRVKAEET